LTSFTFLISLFQDDDEEEEKVPLVRKRKQPSTLTSQPKEGGPSTQEVKEDETVKAKKKKKVEENTAQQAPTKDQGEEKRKKKKNENKRADVVVKVKPTTIKKSKVPRALKIRTSSESGGNPTPRNDTAKNDVVEQDQTVKLAGEEIAGPKGDPASQLETLVKDRKIDNEGKHNDQQGNEDAPNTDKEKGNFTVPEVEAKEVYSTLFFKFKFSISFLSLN
jgi:hypothetical protein